MNGRLLRGVVLLLLYATVVLVIYSPLRPRGRWRRVTLRPRAANTRRAFEGKLDVIRDYSSQLEPLFQNEAAMLEKLERYSARIGARPGEYLERVWKPIPPGSAKAAPPPLP